MHRPALHRPLATEIEHPAEASRVTAATAAGTRRSALHPPRVRPRGVAPVAVRRPATYDYDRTLIPVDPRLSDVDTRIARDGNTPVRLRTRCGDDDEGLHARALRRQGRRACPRGAGSGSGRGRRAGRDPGRAHQPARPHDPGRGDEDDPAVPRPVRPRQRPGRGGRRSGCGRYPVRSGRRGLRAPRQGPDRHVRRTHRGAPGRRGTQAGHADHGGGSVPPSPWSP